MNHNLLKTNGKNSEQKEILSERPPIVEETLALFAAN